MRKAKWHLPPYHMQMLDKISRAIASCRNNEHLLCCIKLVESGEKAKLITASEKLYLLAKLHVQYARVNYIIGCDPATGHSQAAIRHPDGTIEIHKDKQKPD